VSLWAEYIAELEGCATHETDRGFVTFSIEPRSIFIRDMYVRPEHRNRGIASDFVRYVSRLAREQGKRYVTSVVYKAKRTADLSRKAQLAYGFEVSHEDADVIYFKLDLGG